MQKYDHTNRCCPSARVDPGPLVECLGDKGHFFRMISRSQCAGSQDSQARWLGWCGWGLPTGNLCLTWSSIHSSVHSVFTAAPFRAAKIWKQHRCPLTKEWTKEMWYRCICGIHIHTHNGISLSHKKEWNNTICSNMDEPGDNYTKWSKSDKDKYHMISLLWSLRKSDTGTSLVVQCLRIHLAMQGTWVWSLVRKLRFHVLWSNEAHAPRLLSLQALEPQQESPRAATKSSWATTRTWCSLDK